MYLVSFYLSVHTPSPCTVPQQAHIMGDFPIKAVIKPGLFSLSKVAVSCGQKTHRDLTGFPFTFCHGLYCDLESNKATTSYAKHKTVGKVISMKQRMDSRRNIGRGTQN